MFRALVISYVLLTLVFFACKQSSPSEPNDRLYWAQPTWEAFLLFHDSSGTIKADTMQVGQIQYALNRAREVYPQLDSVYNFRSWEKGVFLITVDDSLFQAYDPSIARFGYRPLDSLLTLFPPDSSNKRPSQVTLGYIRFYYGLEYNIPVLAKLFSPIPGVVYAHANWAGIFPGACYTDISLQVTAEYYMFEFTRAGMECGEEHLWEVHVHNDEVTLVKDQAL